MQDHRDSDDQDFLIGLFLFMCFLLLVLFVEEERSRQLRNDALAKLRGPGDENRSNKNLTKWGQ